MGKATATGAVGGGVFTGTGLTTGAMDMDIGGGAGTGGGVRGADFPSSESIDDEELRIESVRQRAGRMYFDAGDFEFVIVVVGDSGCGRSVSEDSRLWNGGGEFMKPELLYALMLSMDTGRTRRGIARERVLLLLLLALVLALGPGDTAVSPSTARLSCVSRSKSMAGSALLCSGSD